MSDDGRLRKPNLISYNVRVQLPKRDAPYYNRISHGRHFGYRRQKRDSVWVARIRMKDGRYRRHHIGIANDRKVADGKTVLDYKQALAAALAWFSHPNVTLVASDPKLISTRKTLLISPIGDVFTVGHALKDYVEWKRVNATEQGFCAAMSLINRHIVPRLASLPVAELDQEKILTFIVDILQKLPIRGGQERDGQEVEVESLGEEALKNRKALVNTLLGMLRRSLYNAWENGKIDDERAWRRVKRLRTPPARRTLHLSREEARRVLDHCQEDVRRLVLGALYTGCRASELVQMRCNQVGRDGYGVYIPPVKSSKARFVFLPDEAMVWFLNLVAGRDPDDYVFLRNTGKPWRRTSYHPFFKAALDAAGIPKEFCFHALRHTYASQLVQAGANIFAIAQQLGHADPSQVLKVYGHLTPQIRESEVRQRFTTLDDTNAHWAFEEQEKLREWRGKLHGAKWDTYARIVDLSAVRNLESTEQTLKDRFRKQIERDFVPPRLVDSEGPWSKRLLWPSGER